MTNAIATPDIDEPYGQSIAVRCPHAPGVAVMVELETRRGERLQRLSCGTCGRGWWECDGSVIDLDQAVDRMRQLAHGLHKRRAPVKETECRKARPDAEREDPWSWELSGRVEFVRELAYS